MRRENFSVKTITVTRQRKLLCPRKEMHNVVLSLEISKRKSVRMRDQRNEH